MYLKLFGFMAIIWSSEMVSQFFSSDFIIADILHCLQGFVIFVIFVLHKSTRELILREYNIARGNLRENPPIEQPKEGTDSSGDSESNDREFRRSYSNN